MFFFNCFFPYQIVRCRARNGERCPAVPPPVALQMASTRSPRAGDTPEAPVPLRSRRKSLASCSWPWYLGFVNQVAVHILWVVLHRFQSQVDDSPSSFQGKYHWVRRGSYAHQPIQKPLVFLRYNWKHCQVNSGTSMNHIDPNLVWLGFVLKVGTRGCCNR